MTQKLKQAFHNIYIGNIVHLYSREKRLSYSSYNITLQQYKDVDVHQSTKVFSFFKDILVRSGERLKISLRAIKGQQRKKMRNIISRYIFPGIYVKIP